MDNITIHQISFNLRLQAAPGNVFLAKRTTRLANDSVVNVSQVVTLDKSFLTERISMISVEKMSDVDDGLRLVLNLYEMPSNNRLEQTAGNRGDR